MLDFRGEALCLYKAIEFFEVITPPLLHFDIPAVDALAAAAMGISSHFRLHPAICCSRQKDIIIWLVRTPYFEVTALFPSLSLDAHFVSQFA